MGAHRVMTIRPQLAACVAASTGAFVAACQPASGRAGCGSAGPAGERVPQGGDVRGAQSEGGEDRVAPPVEPAGGVGEVAVFQAGIQPAGEADRVVDAVALQRCCGVDVVTGLGPPRFSELAAGRPFS